MKRGWIAALPLVAGIGLYLFFAVSDPAAGTYRISGLVARALAATGCFIGAAQFDRGDYMRRAWALLGLCYSGLLANALVFGAVSHGATRNLSSGAAIASGVLVALANVSIVAGAVLVARAWRAAGLNLTVSASTRLAVTVASVLVGLLIAGPSAVTAVRSLAAGNLDAIVRIAASLGDITTLAVLGPILLTALALRGGTLAWPWSMIVAGTVGFLVYDATLTVVGLLQLERVRSVEEALRMFACVCFLSAGLLQRLAVARTEAAPAA